MSQETEKAAVVPGEPAESLFVAFIEATRKDERTHVEPVPTLKEPAEKRLTADEKTLCKRWIEEGAACPLT